MKKLLLLMPVALLLTACGLEFGLNDEQDWDKYDYAITSTSTISNLGELLREKRMEEMEETLKKAAEYYSYKADVINYDYPSIGPDGKQVTLSARLFVLNAQTTISRKAPYVALANHASIVEADQCPSRDLKAEAIFTWFGCPVVMPDYYGFGTSEANPQAYLNSDCVARGNIDALKAAIHILEDKHIKVGGDYYNVGYSQGGFNAIANVRYTAQHPECGIRFKQTFAGAGSYDINASWTEYMRDTYPAAAIFIPLTIIGANECENLGFSYDRIFKEPLLSNYKEWILSKKYSFGRIMDKIGSTKMKDILTDNMLSGDCDEVRTLRKLFEGWSLAKGWTPPAGSKVLLFHSTEDDVVPFFNSQTLYDNLKAAGSNVKLVSGAYGGHTAAEVDFASAIIDNL